MGARARMRTPPGTASTVARGNGLTSTRCAGASTPAFIRSTRFVPPAMNLAPSRPPEVMALAVSVARWKSKGCMLPHGLLGYLGTGLLGSMASAYEGRRAKGEGRRRSSRRARDACFFSFALHPSPFALLTHVVFLASLIA